ncbi:MAG: hypothetical protein H6704_21115 [Myxococcales bacterium]|nr:hypothetical protein [Myxococcales bacterium]
MPTTAAPTPLLFGLLAGATLALVVVLWTAALRARRRRRRRAPHRAPPGAGVALARALEGDLAGAQAALEAVVRARQGTPDVVLGLVAVLRARGESTRAGRWVERLARRSPGPWLQALRLRLALDVGDSERALRILRASAAVPLELELAAWVRAGHWEDALRRYRERTTRKARQPEILGALVAGLAAQRARAGHERSARRLVRRAVGLDPTGLVPAAVGARLHPRAAERERCVGLLKRRAPSLVPGGEATPAESPALAEARAAHAAGDVEVALGGLRDHLEAAPGDWSARRQYVRWLLDAGTPEDWRVELAELLRLGAPAAEEGAGRPRCARCGFEDARGFFVCPRCDALGSMTIEGPGAAPEAAPPVLATGAEWRTLLNGIAPLQAGDDEEMTPG